MENSSILIYQTEDGKTKIETRLENETVWLTQAQLCELFQKSKSTISEHIKNIFEEGELDEISVVRNFRTTAADGKAYETNYYNLDVIIFVGYRVKSLQGTKFRQWATARLREYLIKGFTLNDELLKQAGGGNYFEAFITIDIRRYQEKTLQEWGTQISLGIDQRHWLSEDENEEYKVWVITMEREETPLETRFPESQQEAIIHSILNKIHRSYQQDYGNE